MCDSVKVLAKSEKERYQTLTPFRSLDSISILNFPAPSGAAQDPIIPKTKNEGRNEKPDDSFKPLAKLPRDFFPLELIGITRKEKRKCCSSKG